MTLAVKDLGTLDPDAVDQVQQELAGLLAEQFPQVDLSRGVVHDVVLHLASVLVAAEEANVDALRRSMSLKAIEEDPALATAEVVDRVLSNYRVARFAGAPARGQVTVILGALVPTVIPSGVVFSASGTDFATASAYAVRVSPETVQGATDLVLRPIGGGQYAFSVPVSSTVDGLAGMLRRGTPVSPGFTIPRLVTAYAEGDFTGGVGGETNAELVGRLRRGLAASAWSNRANIDALIHSDPATAQTMQVSVIGYGDPEMARDRHTILPVSLGGRCDAYCRMTPLPASTTLTVAATLVQTTAAGGVWQFGVGRALVPGFYQVDRVALPDTPQSQAGFAVVADVRGFDLSGEGWRPDIATPLEAAYSPWQTATIRFLDDMTPTAGLVPGTATADYQVAFAHLDGLGGLQDYLASRSRRNPGGDVVVKAPVPCSLSVNFEIRKASLAADPDLDAIRRAVADLVNRLGFAGRIHASTVADAIAAYLPPGCATGAIDLFGRIRRPDGTTRHVRDPLAVALEVPDEPDRLVTGRTVAFFCDPRDVAPAIRVVNAPEI